MSRRHHDDATIDDAHGYARDVRNEYGGANWAATWPGKRALTDRLTGSRIDRSASAAGSASAPDASAALSAVAGAAGAPLPADLQPRLERALGADLSAVRVHTGDAAAHASVALGANAFTVGNDIYFAAGRYQPGTRDGDRLVAHEVAHTVQQGGAPSSSGALAVSQPGDGHERDADAFATRFAAGEDTPAIAAGGAPTSIQRDGEGSVGPGAHQQALANAATTLRHVPPLGKAEEKTLGQAIPGAAVVKLIRDREAKRAELDTTAAKLQRITPENGTPEPGGELAQQIAQLTAEVKALEAELKDLAQLVKAGLAPLGVADETELMALVERRFPEMFVARAKAIAMSELNENRKIVMAELDRYGLTTCGTPAGRAELRAAAADLLARQRRMEPLQEQLQTALADPTLPSAGTGDGADGGKISSSAHDVKVLRDRINGELIQIEAARRAYSMAHPILLNRDVDLEALASPDDKRFDAHVGGKLHTILENIKDTEANIQDDTLKVWNLHNIVDLTMQDLGVGESEVLREAVDKHRKSAESDQALISIALAALAITAAIVATVATGGVALVAAGVGLAISIGTAASSIKTYMAESAASCVALDPAVADISMNEPELGWLLLDLIAVGLDAKGVVEAFGALKTLARAATTVDGLTKFGTKASGLLHGRADRILASASRRVSVTTSVRDSIKAAGRMFHKADLATITRRLDEIADKGFKAVFQNLNANGRVRPLTRAALEEFLDAEHSAALLAANHTGYFHPHSGILFIKPGATDSVVSTVVHESSHWLQVSQGAKMELFEMEFQAALMEQRYTKNLRDAAGVSAVPQDMLWMLGADEEKIAAHVLENYPDAIRPETIDGAKTVKDALVRLQAFR